MKVITRACAVAAGVLALAGVTLCAMNSTSDVDATPTARLKLDAHVGKGWNSDSTSIENSSSSFAVGDVVYAVVDIPGDTPGTLRAKWLYQDGTTVHEEVKTVMAGQRNYAFRFGAPVVEIKPGDYTLEVYANEQLEDSERFKVGS